LTARVLLSAVHYVSSVAHIIFRPLPMSDNPLQAFVPVIFKTVQL